MTVDQPKGTVVQRVLALNARVDLHKFRGGYLNAKELSRITVADESLSSSPLRIIDVGDAVSLDVILCELWAAISAFKLRAFFVDSLNPISSTNFFGQYSSYGRVRALTSNFQRYQIC